MLQRLIIGIRYDFGHTFHIPFAGLDQALEILLGPLADIAGTRMKMMRKTVIKISKMPIYLSLANILS